MKMHNTTALLILTIGIIGFVIGQNNSNELQGMTLFEKQERCAANRENAKQQMIDAHALLTPIFYDIFYSPKTDTCVYTYGVIMDGNPPNESGGFAIVDYFTGEMLYNTQYDNSSDDTEQHSYSIRAQFRQEAEKLGK